MGFSPIYTKNGNFYFLQNVQKAKGEKEFFDIWILIESIKDNEKA
jgi:hypothetical protein